jgi:putative PIN family toxin of toxin-antitoxin system
VKVVLDTNVLVSGLLTPNGAPAKIIDLVLRGELLSCYDDRLIAEYRAVLSRDRFGFESHSIEALLSHIMSMGHKVTCSTLPVELPDPNDVFLLEIAHASQAEALVTGNLRDFPQAQRHGVRVLQPADFLKWRAQITADGTEAL